MQASWGFFMPNFAPILKAGARGVDALVDALRTFKFPQDEAMALAQQRAALPIEKGGLSLHPANTAAERAAAMEFDIPAYHGTKKEVEITRLNGNPNKQNQTFVALDPAEANVHVGTRGSQVMPLMVNKGKMAPGIADWAGEDAYAALANKYGRDSFKVRDDFNSPVNLSILNQDNIRSTFAAFDPFRRTAATAAAMGVAAPDLLASELRKK